MKRPACRRREGLRSTAVCLRFFARHFWLLSLAGGCTDLPSAISIASQAVEHLRVQHVSSGNGLASGHAVDVNRVICSQHQFYHSRVASVEGWPMMVGHSPNYTRMKPDAVVLFSTEGHFVPNRVDPTAVLRFGDRVAAAGFPRPETPHSTGKEFLEEKAAFVFGNIVETCSQEQATRNLVLVAVPAANYVGFSGGPAALVGAAAAPTVFGTVVFQGWWWNENKVRHYVLGIARLPKDILSNKSWKSH